MSVVAWRVLLAVGVLSTSAAGALSAQAGARGGVVRDELGRALAGVRIDPVEVSLEAGVVLPSGAPLTATDLAGRFRLTEAALGRAEAVVFRRLGFRPDTARLADLPLGAVAERTLQRLALPLPAMTVTGRREVRGPLAGFYQRRAQGMGRFFTAEEIERRGLRRPSDLIRGVPGVQVVPLRAGRVAYRIRGSNMAPLIWLDGNPMTAAELDLDAFDLRSFAGIEIYAGAATVPPQFTGGRMMSSSGGAIVLWSREGEAQPARRARRGEPTTAEVLARLVAEATVWTADAVDEPARAIVATEVAPLYPDSLFDAGMPGDVEVEFVVDATGEIRLDTFGVVSATHPLLVEAVRRSLAERRFVPARKAGVAVAQLVQYPVRFEPPSGADRVPPT